MRADKGSRMRVGAPSGGRYGKAGGMVGDTNRRGGDGEEPLGAVRALKEVSRRL